MKLKRVAFFIILILTGILFSSCQKVISGAGYVYDSNTRQPIEGALIRAYLDHPSPDAFVMNTQTQSDGGYYVYTQPYACSGTCPKIVVEIIKNGYESAIVESPHNDTTYLVRSSN
ncbi:MAG: hypothetical protein JXR65_09015 [Bacteroidales bacterium]|nr:hypothetical protein [Bacteroidales bacterium]